MIICFFFFHHTIQFLYIISAFAAYQALLEDYKSMFGEDGVKLAAAESGPLDEAYVGGGS